MLAPPLHQRDLAPRGLVLDGELVAFDNEGALHWPRLCDRSPDGNRSIAVTFVAFDVLRADGHYVMCKPLL